MHENWWFSCKYWIMSPNTTPVVLFYFPNLLQGHQRYTKWRTAMPTLSSFLCPLQPPLPVQLSVWADSCQGWVEEIRVSLSQKCNMEQACWLLFWLCCVEESWWKISISIFSYFLAPLLPHLTFTKTRDTLFLPRGMILSMSETKI